MIVAVDFDGTITRGGEQENPGAVRVLKALQNAGCSIIIWTCREGEWLQEGIDWLKERGFVPDAVNANLSETACLGFAEHKIYADVYIDDRSLPPFEGWDSVEHFFTPLLTAKGVNPHGDSN